MCLSGNRALVSTWTFSENRVYLFERNQGGVGLWGLKKILTADATGFGSSVSLHGDRALVGARDDNI